MRKIKTKKKTEIKRTRFLDSKANVIRLGIVASVLVLIAALLMIIESGEGKLIVKNNSDIKLEYIKTYFTNSEGAMSEGINFDNIEANKSASVNSGKHELLNEKANLKVVFKFENYDEIFTNAGFFNDTFEGDISIAFDQTEEADVVELKVKAKNGLLPSSLINCDEEYTVDLSEGYVAE